MKILDNTIHTHILKISNSQNLEDFKFAESDITSPYQKLVGESNSFVLQFQRKKNNIKMTSFLKAQRPPEAPKSLGPAAATTRTTRSDHHKENSNRNGKRFQ
ncbi:hypothetical protein AVEN_47274-1 [Araneus ventricosus]|uniref:Uncharacterized protein n=1 Tax=Araneus ventricosus TaxID=182803 RepID=A0A4Y2GR50_ARAVE|nr:hypothetical protein AVEN_47274-1 [Araneus ventricosus]